MEIKTRGLGKYLNVEIIVNGITHDLGLLDEDEALTLAHDLKEAADDLTAYDFKD